MSENCGPVAGKPFEVERKRQAKAFCPVLSVWRACWRSTFYPSRQGVLESKKMKNANNAAPAIAPAFAWECHVVGDSENDKSPDGIEMFFSAGPEGCDAPSIPARLSLNVNIRPLNLVRRGERWFLDFDFKGGKHESESPVLAVECGEGAPLSLKNAMQLFFAGK